MRRKLLILNFIIVSSSLMILFLVSILVVNNINTKDNEKMIKNYLNLTTEIFDGSNFVELDKITNSNNQIRITIVDIKSGEVLKDTSSETSFDSHKDRDEFKDLNKVIYRYSKTLDINMAYIATIDNNYYVRVSMPKSNINEMVTTLTISGLSTLIVVLILSIVSTAYLHKNALKPLNREMNRLSKIAGNDTFYALDEKVIGEQIDKVSSLIDLKINSINKEKEKLNYIINNMNQAIILLDKSLNIILINDYALNLFDFKYDEIIDKSYTYLIRDINLKDKIEDVKKLNKTNSFNLEIKNKIFKIDIENVNFEWIHNGIFILMIDKTDEINLENSKKEFFANASHELKSPLTVILGYQQMIEQGIITDLNDLKDANARTIKEANVMNQIIAEMLEISRLEANKKNLSSNLFLKDIIKEVIDKFDKEILDRNLNINLELDDLVLDINKNDCLMLFKNLIENAIKYNTDNGSIFIKTDKLKNEFIIKDTGIGIPREDISHVFERFYRVDKAKSRALGGTGLGLSIVKHICINYGYEINLESKLDVGTNIYIKFK